VHELSIALEIRRCVEGAVAERRSGVGARVAIVKVRIGELSGVDPDALLFAWNVAVKGTFLDGARLEIERMPAKIFCLACGSESPVDFPAASCPECGGTRIEIRGGTEMDVVSAQVED
jgi:hydrogenase nickel incorporation protein HypA/HybF